MTIEELKKHVRPLVWELDKTDGSILPINCINISAFILQNEDGTWYSYVNDWNYRTKEEAEQSVEEYHLRELAKFFELEDEPKQERS